MSEDEAEATAEPADVPGDPSEEDSSVSAATIPEDHDIETLRAAQEEARTVMDHQIQNFTELDDKAARTFRLVAVLLGFAITAVSILAEPNTMEPDPFINPMTKASVGSLIVSFVFAVIAFTASNIETGMGSSDIDRTIRQRYTEEEWLILILRSESDWMEQNESVNRRNVLYLEISHFALIVAVITGATGVAMPELSGNITLSL